MGLKEILYYLAFAMGAFALGLLVYGIITSL